MQLAHFWQEGFNEVLRVPWISHYSLLMKIIACYVASNRQGRIVAAWFPSERVASPRHSKEIPQGCTMSLLKTSQLRPSFCSTSSYMYLNFSVWDDFLLRYMHCILLWLTSDKYKWFVYKIFSCITHFWNSFLWIILVSISDLLLC